MWSSFWVFLCRVVCHESMIVDISDAGIFTYIQIVVGVILLPRVGEKNFNI